jgi:hypothetical protein
MFSLVRKGDVCKFENTIFGKEERRGDGDCLKGRAGKGQTQNDRADTEAGVGADDDDCYTLGF